MIKIAIAVLFIIIAIFILNNHESYNITDNYMPILIISLPGSKRRDRIMKRFEKYKGRVMFIDGVYIRSERDRKRWMDILGLDYSSVKNILLKGNGELGCALAHVNAYKYMIDNNINRAVIMEDDAVQMDNSSIEYIENYKMTEEEPSINFLGEVDMYGLQAQIITLQGAKNLYKHRQSLITLEPIDIVIWHKRIPIDYIRGPRLFKHENTFNDSDTSERIQINNNFDTKSS